MKTIASFFLAALMAVWPCYANPWLVVVGRGDATPPAGSAAFSDNFDRANSASLGANWTEAAGDASIAGNQVELQSAAYAQITLAYTGTACSTVNQYVKADTTGGQMLGIVLRYTDASSPLYVVVFDKNEGRIDWKRYSDASTSTETVQSQAFTLDFSATYGVTITGTGASTAVRIWKNPTGLPTAADNWDGDSTPDVSFSNDPSSAVNTGSYAGLAGQQNSAASIYYNNFFGGDIP
jgi:hypothetical protein